MELKSKIVLAVTFGILALLAYIAAVL